MHELLVSKYQKFLNTSRGDSNKKIKLSSSIFSKKKITKRSLNSTPYNPENSAVPADKTLKAKFKYFTGLNRKASVKDPSEIKDTDLDKRNTISSKIPDKNFTPNAKINLSEQKKSSSMKKAKRFAESEKSALIFELEGEESSNNVLKRMLEKIESHKGDSESTDALVDEIHSIIKKYKGSKFSSVASSPKKELQPMQSDSSCFENEKKYSSSLHQSNGDITRGYIDSYKTSIQEKDLHYYNRRRTLFSLEKKDNKAKRFKNNKPSRIVRFDLEDEKRLTEGKKKRNIFSRSKSRDDKSTGSVPATISEFQSIDKIAQYKAKRQEMYKKFFNESKESPKAAVIDLSRTNATERNIKSKKYSACHPRESRLSRTLGGNQIFIVKEALPKENRRQSLIDTLSESSLSDECGNMYYNTTSHKTTKRRRFLNK